MKLLKPKYIFRLNELKELKMHIINYSRTKETYVQYRKKGYSK
jgi:hypothetical protein